jgi:Protein of unknown function (DUF3593)
MSSLIESVLSKESLFAVSLFPYLGFLWLMTKKIPTPKIALIGFYLTLVFVAVTIPVGAYAQFTLYKSLADVDLLHGGAELFLTLSNITIAIGFSQALNKLKVESVDS